MKIDTTYDGRRKPRFALTRMEKICFPELNWALRRSRLLARAPLAGLTAPEASARIDRVLAVGIKTAGLTK